MILPPLEINAHKYSRGVVALAVGSASFPGAAVLAVGGARRGGAGYVGHVSADLLTRSLVLQQFPDVVSDVNTEGPLWQRADALVVGCGLNPHDESARALVQTALRTDAVLVLDGGALALVAAEGSLRNSVRARAGITIITPHAGEAAELGWSPSDDRRTGAEALARELNAVVVLKGAGTVIAAVPCETKVDVLGGAELATAGTGDVLAGLIGSLCAARHATDIASAAAAAFDAVRVHSTAGRLAAARITPVTAVDVLESLPAAVRALDQQESER